MGGHMRLSSVIITAAIVMFALVGMAALDDAAAQEESAKQTFESREITGPKATPENTTPTPTSEQSTREVQASTECPGAEVIGTTGPTDEDVIIGPFVVTGDKFRLTYETTDADESGLPFFDVTVLDEARNEVGGRVIFDEGIEREIVGASPGSFTIEARAEDLKYTITGEDCTGRDSGGDGRQPVPINPVPVGQYKSDVDPPKDDVIDNTVSKKPLPNTGGVPLLGLTVFGFICVSAAFALLRPIIRQNP
jgi:hypothetical protein